MEAPAAWSAQTDFMSCDQVQECTCSMGMVSRYQKRASGPLLDRIDIHIEVLWGEYEKLSPDGPGKR